MEHEEQRTRHPGNDRDEPQGAFRCTYCGSETYEGVVKAAFWGSQGLLAIEDIPAWVCQGCGEQFYGEETTRKIEKLLIDPAARPVREILVPVFSLAEIEGAASKGSPPE